MLNKKPRPWRVLASEAIERLSLSCPESAVMNALLNWTNQEDLTCYPSVPRIARRARLTDRGVRKILRRLEDKGAIVALIKSKGGRRADGRGKSSTYRLMLPGIGNEPNPERSAGLDATLHDRQPGTPRASTRNASATNPERRSGEASMHPSREVPSQASPIARVGADPNGNTFDDRMHACPGPRQDTHEPKRLRSVLAACGIKGTNLERLAASENLTPEHVVSTRNRLAASGRCRDLAAVLTKVLEDDAGIDLNVAHSLPAATIAAHAFIEQLRRNQKRLGQASTIGQVVRTG